MRFPQIKNIATAAALREHVAKLGIDLPLVDQVDPDGALSTATSFADGSAGTFVIPNRFAVLPMEGWDGTLDGHPTDLVRRRWQRFGQSGCGLVWGEATAVQPEGRANPNQLMLNRETIEAFAELRTRLHPSQVVGLQLTHSGRWSRPVALPAPRTAYEHPELDLRVRASSASVLSDAELDDVAQGYVKAATLASGAGFDFVDIKHCHGYLLHELLSARSRTGRYGGPLRHRTHFLRRVVDAIRANAPSLAIAVRLSMFDTQPFRRGPDGVGQPSGCGSYPYSFGSDPSGTVPDLAEPHELMHLLGEMGIGLVCTTAGSPYYNPHVQRPAYFPPSDGYRPPEDPLVGVARQLNATAELAREHLNIAFVGSAYSYLQDWLPNVAQAVVEGGSAAMIGLGRMALSTPTSRLTFWAVATLIDIWCVARSAIARPRRATGWFRVAFRSIRSTSSTPIAWP